jgi:hypothetical protein
MLALTLPTRGGRSVGIVRSRTQATEFSLAVIQALLFTRYAILCRYKFGGLRCGCYYLCGSVWPVAVGSCRPCGSKCRASLHGEGPTIQLHGTDKETCEEKTDSKYGAWCTLFKLIRPWDKALPASWDAQFSAAE